MSCKFCLLLIVLPVCAFAITDEAFIAIQRAQRQVDAHTTKSSVAAFDLSKPIPPQSVNGDEKAFSDLRGNFNKGLLHMPTGFPNIGAYNSLVKALLNHTPLGFDAIELGIGAVKLVNPQASLAYSLSANDSWINAIPQAPSFTSEEVASEMVELYWTVLARDIPFNEFIPGDPIIDTAVAELENIPAFTGPRNPDGTITPNLFLRGRTIGDITGPYISQFLYLPVPFGSATIDQTSFATPTMSTTNDFNTNFVDWFTVVSGGSTGETITFGPSSFIRTPRDLAEYVHQDFPGQSALSALLILNAFGNAALDPANPYLVNPTQQGFVTFGISEILTLTRTAVQEAFKAAWFHKWQINRRLRPEEFGFYVQQQVGGGLDLGINAALTSSAALPMVFANYSGTYFLPVAYPEGSPIHPSYPAGHAAAMGAAVTILKAFFNEDFVIPSPVEPNPANDALIPFALALTVGGELNKLASNIALGRDHAGVHYRSDGFQGLALGEQVAIDLLNNESFLFNEDFEGFTLTKFNGQKIRVGGNRKESPSN